jgi:cell filamentation protein
LVEKGASVQFEVSELCQRAVEWGLRMGNDHATMRTWPGKVIGAFAWGHPFLDGNGRTMLVVHSVPGHRAGISVAWSATRKQDYLNALTQELQQPQGHHLDAYLRPFVQPATAQGSLLERFQGLPGLDGRGSGQDVNIAYAADDPRANSSYLDTKRSRGELGPGHDDAFRTCSTQAVCEAAHDRVAATALGCLRVLYREELQMGAQHTH